jgi:cell division protein FtsW
MRNWTNEYLRSKDEGQRTTDESSSFDLQYRNTALPKYRKTTLLRDPILFVLALAASVMGLVFVFDAGYARSLRDGYGMIPREFVGQILYVGIAVGIGWLCSRLRGDIWERLARPGWVLNIALLGLVLVFGMEMNGAHRWFKIGPITVQPAEFAKVAIVVYLAAVFANRKGWRLPELLKSKKRSAPNWALALDHVWIPRMRRIMPAFWVLACLVLIELEPDLGTGFIVATTAFALFWVGGVSRKSLVWCLAIAGILLFAIIQLQPYRLERITTHFDRWNPSNVDGIAYQTVQSELAMASGGLVGVGMGVGRAKHVMPAATTDFIAATIGEEFGFLGWLAVVGVLGGITWRLVVNAQRAPTKFGQLALLGFGSWIGMQSVVNLMMANGTAPAIGIPLPFISSGGSSLVALWMAVGISQAALVPALARSSKGVAPQPVPVGNTVRPEAVVWR